MTTQTAGRGPATPRELMEWLGLQLRSDPDRTDGINCVFAFIVSGATGGDWWIDAKNGTGTVHAGTPPQANVTIHLSDGVMLRLASGDLDGAEAFANELLTVEGDQSKAVFLGQIFGV